MGAAAENAAEEKAPMCPCRLILFCTNLFIGLICSQLIPEAMVPETYFTWKRSIKGITMFCVSYIMIHVGFHFDIEKGAYKKYGTEYLVAMTAAGFPWIFCSIYFMFALGPGHNKPWQEALIAGRFAAPTSAGILFTMLEAAGMKETWLFRKARILAIFDDLDTLLLMVPLKAIHVGAKWELSIDLIFVTILLFLMYFFLHSIKLPATWPWVASYAFGVAFLCEMVHFLSSSEFSDPNGLVETLHLEVLLPAFTVGCVIKIEDHDDSHQHIHKDQTLTDIELPKKECGSFIHADTVKLCISAVFMVLVGFSMPALFKASHEESAHRRLAGDDIDGDAHAAAEPVGAGMMVVHVLACTVLMNLGKLFPACCYRKEVNLKTRIALAVAMMPRGEVCAGIIVNALALGVRGTAMTVAVFCLTLNMTMVSVFIFIVKKLTADGQETKGVNSANAAVDDAKAKGDEVSASAAIDPAAITFTCMSLDDELGPDSGKGLYEVQM